jgi:hypothetical protein
MIIYSNEVKNVLDRIFLEEIALRGNELKTYNQCIETLDSLENSIITYYAHEPFAWKRDKVPYVKAGRYWFSYKRYPSAIIVQEVYDSQKGIIITEGIMKVKSLMERIEKLQN